MSKMKHLLRKLHIGGGGGGGDAVSDHWSSTAAAPPAAAVAAATSCSSPSSSFTVAPSSTSSSLPSPATVTMPDSAEPASVSSSGSRCEPPPGGNFTFFEEEYQMQLALALSASDPDCLEDPDSVQMKAATQMSLGCSTAASAGDATEENMEYLSRRYWNYNVVDYEEKLLDGFYDVYSITSNHNLQDQMPSLVDLQAISVSDSIDYVVVIVNRIIDVALQQLERRAMSIFMECGAAQVGPVASGLVQKIADLVVDSMGGQVGDADDMLRRWTTRSCELCISLNTILLPLGTMNFGLSRHRALLFKVLADRINLPCKLVKGSYYTGTDEGAVNLIKLDYDSEYIIDLMGAPGVLIPAENPSSNLQYAAPSLLISNTIEQTVKDLCFALDRVSCQLEKRSEVSEGTSSNSNVVSEITDLQLEEKCRADPAAETVCTNVTKEKQTQRFEHAFGELRPLLSDPEGVIFQTKDGASPAQQMQVSDVSKYVVNAAKDPEFAQKLHAVLLESGAAPPPDLFSDLLSSPDMDEQTYIERTICKETREVEKEAHPPQKNLVLNLQPFPVTFKNALVPFKEVGASSSTGDSCNEQNAAEEFTHKGHVNAGYDGCRIEQRMPVASSEVLRPHVIGGNEIAPVNSKFNRNTLVLDSAVQSRTHGKEFHEINSRQKQIISVPKAFGAQYNDLRTLVGTNSDQINPILDDVAEWEIPWEDLQVGERIGLGSYGEVYRADWNGTEVAVKKLLNQDLSGDALEQFRCEVKIMLRLRHPNVVLFMGAVTRPPNLSILTEFLPRGSLYRLLHRPSAQIDEKRRLKMALDVARGMNYLHTSNPTIVHRDLKSANLLVDKNWVVKVCDFGLSKLKHHTFLSSKSTAGTPEWMAPEVLRNELSNEKSDVYSFGVILWELATLRMPWSGMNPMQVVGAVGFQNRCLDIPKEVDPMAAEIISDCWQSEPNQRPSFSQLMTPLKQLKRLVAAVS